MRLSPIARGAPFSVIDHPQTHFSRKFADINDYPSTGSGVHMASSNSGKISSKHPSHVQSEEGASVPASKRQKTSHDSYSATLSAGSATKTANPQPATLAATAPPHFGRQFATFIKRLGAENDILQKFEPNEYFIREDRLNAFFDAAKAAQLTKAGERQFRTTLIRQINLYGGRLRVDAAFGGRILIFDVTHPSRKQSPPHVEVAALETPVQAAAIASSESESEAEQMEPLLQSQENFDEFFQEYTREYSSRYHDSVIPALDDTSEIEKYF